MELLAELRRRAAERMTPEIAAIDQAAREERQGRILPSSEGLDLIRERALELADHRPSIPGSMLRQRIGWKLERLIVHGTSPALQELRGSVDSFNGELIGVLAALAAELDDCRSRLREVEARLAVLEGDQSTGG